MKFVSLNELRLFKLATGVDKLWINVVMFESGIEMVVAHVRVLFKLIPSNFHAFSKTSKKH